MAINSLHNYVLSAEAVIITTAVTLASEETLPLLLVLLQEALNLIANSVPIHHLRLKREREKRNNDRNIIFNHFFICF